MVNITNGNDNIQREDFSGRKERPFRDGCWEHALSVIVIIVIKAQCQHLVLDALLLSFEDTIDCHICRSADLAWHWNYP